MRRPRIRVPSTEDADGECFWICRGGVCRFGWRADTGGWRRVRRVGVYLDRVSSEDELSNVEALEFSVGMEGVEVAVGR